MVDSNSITGYKIKLLLPAISNMQLLCVHCIGKNCWLLISTMPYLLVTASYSQRALALEMHIVKYFDQK